jgi:hypothetical protein
MQERVYWSPWAQFLQHMGVHEAIAALLEAGGALNMFLAQVVYLGQPLLGRGSSSSQWEALAHMLENQEEVRSFASYLRLERPLPDGTSPAGEGTSPTRDEKDRDIR